MNPQRVWLAEMLDLALELGLVTHRDILQHVGTDQIARALPKGEIARLLAAGLDQKTFTPETIGRTIGVALLVVHVSTDDLWSAIREGVARGLASQEASDSQETTQVQAAPVREPVAAKQDEQTPEREQPAARQESPAPAARAQRADAPPKGAPPKAAPPKPRRTSTILGGSVAPPQAQPVQVQERGGGRHDRTERTSVPDDLPDDVDEVLDALDEEALQRPT